MFCPVCKKELEKMEVGGVVVDVCRGGCGGIWFDHFELMKFDEPHELAGEALLNIERDESIIIDYEKRRVCPRCEDIVMMRHFFSVKREVEIDECPRCGGFWLDAGELSKIRSLFISEEERRAAAERSFSELFDKKLNNMRMESIKQSERAKKISHILRFICPSYYIPGKQDWGAF